MNRLVAYIAATLLALPSSAPALGQTTLTVAGGLNIASVSTSERPEANESLTRMVMGLAAGIPVAAGWSVRLGAAYSQKGFGFAAVDIGIDYIELTALLDRALPVGDRASLHLQAGPALGFRSSCKATVSRQGEKMSEDCGDAGYKSVDFGATGGVEAVVGPPDRPKLSVGAFYTLGLLDISESEGDEFIKNRTLTLRAGVAFSIP